MSERTRVLLWRLAILSLGVIGIVMALGIKQVETRLLRWRPEYRSRG